MLAHSTQARHFSFEVEMSCQMLFSYAIKNPTQGQRMAIIARRNQMLTVIVRVSSDASYGARTPALPAAT